MGCYQNKEVWAPFPPQIMYSVRALHGFTYITGIHTKKEESSTVWHPCDVRGPKHFGKKWEIWEFIPLSLQYRFFSNLDCVAAQSRYAGFAAMTLSEVKIKTMQVSPHPLEWFGDDPDRKFDRDFLMVVMLLLGFC